MYISNNPDFDLFAKALNKPYFSKFFKKFAGMSPREYRAINKMQLVTSSRQPGSLS